MKNKFTFAFPDAFPEIWFAKSKGFSVCALGLALGFFGTALPLTGFSAGTTTELSDVPSPYLDDDDLPARAKPLIELGSKFLATGNIKRGIKIPTGAVWTPSLWVYGNYRTAYQAYQSGSAGAQRTADWSNRLDLFANLQLSGTERVLLGLRPLHQGSRFSGKILEPEGQEETIDAINSDVDTLFFEGDFAEVFPRLDVKDSKANDVGFTIGRQLLQFQEGFIVNDNMDGIGFSKNNIRFKGNSSLINLRSSVFFGLDGVNRHDNAEDTDAKLVGIFNQIDGLDRTYNLDVVFVDSLSKGDLLNFGFDATQRAGKINQTFRIAMSRAMDGATSQADDGVLVLAELSMVPPHTDDNAYLNLFSTFDNYTSAARGPLAGGPLGRAGILFAAQGLGSAPSPLSNASDESAGFALGYQRFFNNNRRQLIVELGARFEQTDSASDEYGLGLRYQQAVGRRAFWQLDMFATEAGDSNGSEYGSKLELQIKF